MKRLFSGFTKEQFELIHNQMSLRNSDQRSSVFVLSVYLFWLKTGSIEEC